MLVNDILIEKHYSGPLYHVTDSESAIKILKDSEFMFTNALGSFSERRFIFDKEYKYFMSTSRSKVHGMRNKIDVLFYATTFVLDPSWFANKKEYIINPLWFGYEATVSPEYKESEERIWSNKQLHSIDSIRETHCLFLKKDEANYNNLKKIRLLCERNNMPCYFYNDVNSYLMLNKKKAVNI